MENSKSKWIFSALVIALSVGIFGGVDLWAQSLVMLLLAVGLWRRPLRLCALPPYLWFGFGAFFAFLVLKEILPASWFPSPLWRKSLVEDFGVVLGKTHHPELHRFFQLFMAGAGLGVLVLWWRSFSDTRALRIHLAWTGFIVVVAIALLSFVLRGPSIFRIRETLGYDGFGPFPNRNHTGTLFVMGIFLGWGCGWESWRHRLTLQWMAVLVGIGVLAMALVAANSRGALLAGVISFGVVLSMIYLRRHDFRFLIVGASLLVIGMSIVSVGGSSLKKRFQGEMGQGTSISGRVMIWKDALKVVGDAPVLGHGIGMYEKIHPFYQTYEKPNHQVLHPESTYLQLLSEMGIPLVLLLSGLLFVMVVPAWDDLGAHHHQFPLRICSLGACVALALHGFVDVSALRWGDAVVGALCWTVFTSVRLPSYEHTPLYWRWSFCIPLFFAWGVGWMAWKGHQRFGVIDYSKRTTAEVRQLLEGDPLNGLLRHEMGMRYVKDLQYRELAYREFRLSHQLLPSVWTLPIEAARAAQPYSEGVAFSFWGRGIERSGHRQAEIFLLAYDQTRALPNAPLFWRNFVETHPAFIPSYLLKEKPSDGADLFDLWKEKRGSLPIQDLFLEEKEAMYEVVPTLNRSDFFIEWVRTHEGMSEGEVLSGARVLARSGKQEQGWEMISKTLSPLEFHEDSSGNEEALKAEWRRSPQNMLNAQRLVEWYHSQKRFEERDQVLIQVAKVDGSPLWFRQKAAQVLAEKKEYSAALQLLLPP